MEQKQRDSFVIYRSQIEVLKKLDANDSKLLLTSMADYALDNIEPEFTTPLLEILWMTIKPQIDANKRKYENGCKGGAPKGSRNNPYGRRGKPKVETNEERTTTNQPLHTDTDKDNGDTLVEATDRVTT